MYASEYLRNKKRAAAQIQSPTRIRDSGLFTQIRRYQSSVPQNLLPISAGQSKLLSGDGFINAKAGAAVCCGPVQATVEKPASCCDLITPQQFPINFYGGKAQDCCPVNGPPVTAVQCCPNLPKNSPLVTWTKKPRTQG
jgi:hypothetical protein